MFILQNILDFKISN